MTHQNTSTHYNDSWINIDIVTFVAGYNHNTMAVLTSCEGNSKAIELEDKWTSKTSSCGTTNINPSAYIIRTYGELFDDIFKGKEWDGKERLKNACLEDLKKWFEEIGIDPNKIED